MILKGAEASGKTHLLRIFAKKFAAKFLNKEEIFSVNPVEFFRADHFYILEDFCEITDEESGFTIKCTEDHLIFTKNRGYVKAKDLNELDILDVI